jgi:SRSO17 transposase
LVSGTAEAIAAALPASRWVQCSAGTGSKGPRLYDWAYLELADLDARSFFGCRSAQTLWTRGLLIRRGLRARFERLYRVLA